MESSATYTPDGNYLTSMTDARGNSISYLYNQLRGMVKSSTDPLGTTNYTYDLNTEQLLAITRIVGNQEFVTSYTYDSAHRVKTITSNDITYSFNYDMWGNVTQIYVAGSLLVTNYYRPDNGLLERSVYNNGYEVSSNYDRFGRAYESLENGAVTAHIDFDAWGNVGVCIDHKANLTYTYTYDLINRPIIIKRSDGYMMKYLYDINANLTSTEIFKNGVKLYGDTNTYDLYDRLTSIEYNLNNANDKLSFNYDKLNRLSSQSLTMGVNSFDTSYGYLPGTNGSTTNLINNSTTSYNGVNLQTYGYVYDNIGNITEITLNNSLYAAYEYDGLGQLLRENNAAAGRTWVMTYDNGGNILTKKEYNYTTGSVNGLTPRNSLIYTYDNVWKDKLTKVVYTDNITPSNSYTRNYKYDAIGNPIEIGGVKYGWNGRQLIGIGANDSIYSRNTRLQSIDDWDFYGQGYVGDSEAMLFAGNTVLAIDKDSPNSVKVEYRADIELPSGQTPRFMMIARYNETTGNFAAFGYDNGTWLWETAYAGGQLTGNLPQLQQDRKYHLEMIFGGSSSVQVYIDGVLCITAYSLPYPNDPGYCGVREWAYSSIRVSNMLVFDNDNGSTIYRSELSQAAIDSHWDFVVQYPGYSGLDWYNVQFVRDSGVVLSSAAYNNDGAVGLAPEIFGPDVELIAKFRATDLDVRALFLTRCSGAFDYVGFGYDATTGWFYQNGYNFANLQNHTLPALKRGVEYEIKIVSKGQHFEIYLDGVLGYSGKAPLYASGGSGRCGVRTWFERSVDIISFEVRECAYNINYAYDAGGLRISKDVSGVITNFTYIDGLLYKQTNSQNPAQNLEFIYAGGALIAIVYNGNTYTYLSNGQGDVIGLLDSSGNLVVEYMYDPFGKVISITGSMAGTLGAANPLRYGGGYFDSETGYYYLGSRYYDPEIGRFLDSDESVITAVTASSSASSSYGKANYGSMALNIVNPVSTRETAFYPVYESVYPTYLDNQKQMWAMKAGMNQESVYDYIEVTVIVETSKNAGDSGHAAIVINGKVYSFGAYWGNFLGVGEGILVLYDSIYDYYHDRRNDPTVAKRDTTYLSFTLYGSEADTLLSRLNDFLSLCIAIPDKTIITSFSKSADRNIIHFELLSSSAFSGLEYNCTNFVRDMLGMTYPKIFNTPGTLAKDVRKAYLS